MKNGIKPEKIEWRVIGKIKSAPLSCLNANLSENVIYHRDEAEMSIVVMNIAI